MTLDSSYQPEAPRGPTAYEAFNSLYWSLSDYQAGRCSADSVSERFGSAREELELLDNHLRREAAMRPLTPGVEEILPDVYRILLRSRELFEVLSEHLEAGRMPAADLTLSRLSDAYQRLDNSLGAISRLEQERPTFSESPLVDELIHSCYAFLEGRLGAEPVLLRIDLALEHFEGRIQLLDSAEPLPGEAGILEQDRLEVSETVERQLEALGGLRENTEDPEAFLLCLEEVRQTTDRLIALQRRLARSGQEPEPLACVACGAENRVGDRVCASCGARLPQPVAVTAPGDGLDVTIGGAAEATSGVVMTANIQRLLAAADAVGSGRGENEVLSSEIEAMRKRIAESRAKLAGLTEPDSRTPEAQLELFRSTRTRLAAGMEILEEALDELARFTQDHNPIHLESGTNRLLEAQAALIALQSQAEEVIQQARRGG